MFGPKTPPEEIARLAAEARKQSRPQTAPASNDHNALMKQEARHEADYPEAAEESGDTLTDMLVMTIAVLATAVILNLLW